MTLLKHPEDRIPVTLFFLFFAADWTVYFTATNPWILVIWFAAGIIPKGCVCAWNHHHQHVPMFRHAVFNRILELGFALQTGITTTAGRCITSSVITSPISIRSLTSPAG